VQDFAQKVADLLDELVRQNSVSYAGQRETARFLFDHIRSSRYFSKDRENVLSIPTALPGEPFSIMAVYESPKRLRETIILCGHFDTVNVEEFGERSAVAFNQEELIPWLKERFSNDEELQADIESGRYYFGRGSLDMKGAVAMLTELFLAVCEKSVSNGSDAFPWNLILLLTCDEEGTGAGIRSALPYLQKLKDEAKLDFRLLVNADFTHTDETEPVPIFCGTIGKVLVGVSVFGTETHAGAPYEGVNASSLLSAILAHLECNPKLTEHVKGEFTPPPTVLSAIGAQKEYSVKTPSTAHAYLNLFFMHPVADKLMDKVVNEVRRACRIYLRSLKKKYNTFSAKSNRNPSHALVTPRVFSFSQLLKELAKQGISARPAELVASRQPIKDRLSALEHTLSALEKKFGLPRPFVVVSFLEPFYAPYSMRLDPGMNKTFENLREFARGYRPAKLAIRQFYPFISDMSFLHPLKKAKADEFLNQMLLPDEFLTACAEASPDQLVTIPTINLGPIGKGAHSVKERVSLPFLLEKLPKIYIDLLSHLTGTTFSIM